MEDNIDPRQIGYKKLRIPDSDVAKALGIERKVLRTYTVFMNTTSFIVEESPTFIGRMFGDNSTVRIVVNKGTQRYINLKNALWMT